MDAILVSHPGAVSFVPARGRVERMALALVRTPVILRSLHRDELEPLAWPLEAHEPVRHATFLHEGEPWTRLVGADPQNGKPYYATADDLRTYLEDGTGEVETLQRSFNATPVAATHDGSERWGSQTCQAFRGEPVDIERARHVSFDLRAEAAADVGAYLDRNIRIVGNAAYVRRTLLMGLRKVRPDGKHGSELITGVGTLAFDDLVASGASHAAAVAHIGSTERMPPKVRAWLDSLPPGAGSGDEVTFVANGYVAPLRALLAIQADRLRGSGGPGIEELRAARDALRPRWIRSLTRTAGRDDPAADIAALAEALQVLMDHSAPNRTCRFQEARLMEALRGFYLPIASPAPDPADLDALAAVGPWGMS